MIYMAILCKIYIISILTYDIAVHRIHSKIKRIIDIRYTYIRIYILYYTLEMFVFIFHYNNIKD